MEAVLVLGLVLLWGGSWHRNLPVAALGVLIVLAAWARGWWTPKVGT